MLLLFVSSFFWPQSHQRNLYCLTPWLFTAHCCLTSVCCNEYTRTGYLKLWTRISRYLDEHTYFPSETGYKSPDELSVHGIREFDALGICTGSEWYQFASHFFVSAGWKLKYFEDGFTGQLPQQFVSYNGTFAQPKQPFNDRNEEQRERYVAAEDCQYLVLLVDDSEEARAQMDPEGIRARLLRNETLWGNNYHKLLSEKVLSPLASASTPSLLRAFYVPFLTPKAVKMQEYVMYEKLWTTKKLGR